MNPMFCFKMVRKFVFLNESIHSRLVLQGHGVSSDTTGQPIVESNTNEHYLGLVNVRIYSMISIDNQMCFFFSLVW